MDDELIPELLASWLGSAPVRWVRRSGLALVIVTRARIRCAGPAAGCPPASFALLVAAWERAIAFGAPVDGAVLATMLADRSVGGVSGPDALADRAIDLTLRAAATASDVRRLSVLRERPESVMRDTLRVVTALIRLLDCESGRRRCAAAALDLEDAAMRAAGEALVAELIASQWA